MPAYIGQTEHLLCRWTENTLVDWVYQMSQNAERHKISVNGSLGSVNTGSYTIEGSSLIINEVRLSDAGIYICGHGSQLYHKLQLTVAGRYFY